MSKALFARLGLGCAALFLLLASAGTARAQSPMWGGALYAKGVEVRVDERAFTLYAAFNMLGYDRDTVQREHPVPLVVMHPARVRVRDTLAPLKRTWAPRFQPVFDKLPQPAFDYLSFALAMGAAPQLAAPAAAPPRLAPLAEVAPVLKAFYDGAFIQRLYTGVNQELRATLKQFIPEIDKRVDAIETLVRMDPDDDAGESRLIFAFNPLDAHGSFNDVELPEERYVVVGPVLPGKGSPVDRLVAPYAENLLATWIAAIPPDSDARVHARNLYQATTKADPALAKAHPTWESWVRELVGAEIARRVLGQAAPSGVVQARVAAAMDAFVSEGSAQLREYLPILVGGFAKN